MSTEPVYCFEHAATNTIVRGTDNSSAMQILREGWELARFRCHMNSQISFSEDGKAAFHDGYGHLKWVDLAAPVPPEAETTHKGTIIAPDGQSVLTYAMPAYPYQKQFTGLLHIDMEAGNVETIWDGDTSQPTLIYPFGEATQNKDFDDWEQKRWRPVSKDIEFPEVVMATDNETWALITSERLVIGRNGEMNANLYWHGYRFYPVKYAFDLPRQRLLISGPPGIVAFSFRGKIEAA